MSDSKIGPGTSVSWSPDYVSGRVPPKYKPIEPTKPAMRLSTVLTLDPPDGDGFWRAQSGCVVAYRRDPVRAVEAALRERLPELAEALAAGASVVIVRSR